MDAGVTRYDSVGTNNETLTIQTPIQVEMDFIPYPQNVNEFTIFIYLFNHYAQNYCHRIRLHWVELSGWSVSCTGSGVNPVTIFYEYLNDRSVDTLPDDKRHLNQFDLCTNVLHPPYRFLFECRTCFLNIPYPSNIARVDGTRSWCLKLKYRWIPDKSPSILSLFL